ncbi:VOC family protein [Guptibacillus algicola]|uniref:VOC family protein n=1 Tax=Guptibacillus algicola TaxID=225844 RepID=UPI001CD4CBCF|nr:VOC family protein [Alkalihalobacillus algicola]MCA0988483.1 VOC family protein [Alkalihalobacillus algicola]
MNDMISPIANKVHTIFVHVTDLESSVLWYTKLLSQEVDLEEVRKPVYNLKINHHTGVVLDAGPEGETKQVDPSKHPIFNFHTDDIQQAYSFVKELGYKIDSEPIHFDDFSFFTVEDPDGNVVMICTG